ncbi:putative restriction endonuclease/methyltransferase (plasmid) [Cupriavidus taiwanensis LMG 19424]|uniref:site-specific DNA-methyltransferase (adenine-specific) n=1 Tax=Cupriavidus taiwanensis (strain DSM 17343 / BCRC 17206 / CCUG 44338 / CIP 107171 / LMG 19424 / R1) TaxID=977880 RepID=B2AJN4_CUPTR|nr:putative restriction endonuclease/methyltransferase [Cupriavidus taiwanensis LMG 19424]
MRRANTEAAKKERFLQYLSAVFAHDLGAQELIAALSLGAERTVANVVRGGKASRGRADTQTNTVIVEWEKDLSRTGEHAMEQLEEYLAGNWRSGQEYRFILIATDGIKWRIYAPDWSTLEMGQFSLTSNYSLREIRKFDLTEESLGEFPFFLDEILFASQPKIATLESIRSDFGDTSSTFINSISFLFDCIKDFSHHSELQVALDQWRKFLSVAYGRFDASPGMFLVHTYLSIFAKLIAFSVIAEETARGDQRVKSILSGKEFAKFNVERFIEDDFFHWVNAEPYFSRLKPAFREINNRIGEYDLTDVREDILKGVYQELVDLDTRHALGEYYTPDWLCEKIVEETRFTETYRVLDPACGSGSFLRAAIAKMRNESPQIDATTISRRVVGIDIHPLSVQIAKTTIIIAMGKLIAQSNDPVTLHIYLANSLLVPETSADLFESTFKVSVDNRQYSLNVARIAGPDEFDSLITFCDDLVRQHEGLIAQSRFFKLATSALDGATDQLKHDLYFVYRGMKEASINGRDSIWKFILQNSYKPVFLRGQFDLILGNPPWLTYADVTNSDYQQMLMGLADHYNVTPPKRADIPHLEIAAIFVAHSVNYFLKPSGTLAFVLPRSFVSASQHENIRRGTVSSLELKELWDLNDVSPLFRVPSCVMFFKHSASDNLRRRVSLPTFPGKRLEGKLPREHLHWGNATRFIRLEDVSWHLSTLGASGARSAFTVGGSTQSIGTNAYEKKFSQGATVVPRNFFFIDLETDYDGGGFVGRTWSVRTATAAAREAKAPWKNHSLTGRIEGDYIFRTAIANNLVPFALFSPPIVALPITENGSDQEATSFSLLNNADLLGRRSRYAAAWFSEAEHLWDKHRTEKNRKNGIGLLRWLNWQNKLTDQNPSARYLVIYTSSGQDACAAVVDRQDFDAPFIAEHKTYWAEFGTRTEADYVSAFINSDFANFQIKDFQSRGLFGARDIHKLIVKVPFPRYDASNEMHKRLSALGRKCGQSISTYLEKEIAHDASARGLGRLRARIREMLSGEMQEIDEIVSVLSTGRSIDAAARRGKKRSRQPRLPGLFD